MAVVSVKVVCKCGKVIRTVNVGSNTKTRGNETCLNCKRKIKYEIIDGKAYVYEVGK